MADTERSPARSGALWFTGALAAVIVGLVWLLGGRGDGPEALGADSAEPPATEEAPRDPRPIRAESEAAREEPERTEPLGPDDGPGEETPAESTATVPPPAAVVLGGAAVRVDAEGVEHASEDGTLKLAWRADDRGEQRDVEVTGGRFSVEVPADVVLHVAELTLGGAPITLEDVEHTVPADRFLLLRGTGMQPLSLRVLAAEDGRELEDVEVRAGGYYTNQATWRHPGAAPEGAVVAEGGSPLRVVPALEGRGSKRSYWVRAPGRAWAGVSIDHASGGEREVRLERAASLVVELVGSAEWLRPKVRLSLPDARPGAAYGYAEREPDAEQSATFEFLAPGTYVVTVERGWAKNRVSFGEETLTLTAGEHARLAIGVELPERPEEVRITGHLVVEGDWELEPIKLVFSAQDSTAVWTATALTLTIDAMSAEGGGRFAWEKTLPVAGGYEVAVQPMYVRRLLAVPPGGLEDVEIVVPAPADVEVRFIDEERGEEILVDRIHWSPQRVEGILGTRLVPATADPETGRVNFRAPAAPVHVWPVDLSLRLVEENEVFELEPGPNELVVAAQRQIGVRFRFLDGEATLPWSWDWRLRATQVNGSGHDVGRSIGMLWFRDVGTYELFADGGIPGYAPIDGTTFEVRVPRWGEPTAEVEVRLERE